MASKRKNRRYQKERRIKVRGVRRDPPDIRKLSKALIALAMAEAEREAQAARETHTDTTHRATPSTVASPDEPDEGGDAHA